MRLRPHACCTLCATRSYGGRPPARTARTGGAAGARTAVRNVRTPPCATCVHGYRPAGETHAGMCVQGVRGRRATPAVTCARDLRTIQRYPPPRVRTPCATGDRQRVAVVRRWRGGRNFFLKN
ncbi:hypothetical protein F511_06179 [Dorcoceras hygrometricum]|uniref:Uncharacterized protein n=1 Tax=Dorcoceras hygrometricum TaxID=472368 RepID=A0A2Z7CM04_9LAMI|nr:hypothetical protein F511_06179 [Dorcoceras hygrometricum]